MKEGLTRVCFIAKDYSLYQLCAELLAFYSCLELCRCLPRKRRKEKAIDVGKDSTPYYIILP